MVGVMKLARKTRPEEVDRWRKMYEAGNCLQAIADKESRDISVIYSWLKKRGIKLRHTKQARGTWRDVPIEKAAELYKTGISVGRVAREIGFAPGLVLYALKKHGIKTKKRNNLFTDEEVLKLYEEGHAMETIADMLGVKRTKVRTALLKSEADIRHREPYDLKRCELSVAYEPYGERKCRANFTKSTMKYASNSRIYTDENFFAEWSHELAYFLGWMASDGNISPTKHAFRLTSTDIEHLEKLFSLFSYGWTVSLRKWSKPSEAKYSPAGTISISRKDIMERLIEYGITPNKSLTIKMPSIPPEYLRDFVRGVFEGDGCITFKNSLSPNIVFASGSREFLEGLGVEIQAQTGLKIYVSVDKKGAWKLSYNSPAAAEIFFRYIYDGVPETMILERKHNKFLDYFARKGVDILAG
ncbi:MAG: hypothetical protein HPY66_1656 [Firmicutes bacterium]|nr:hypothetical protein [Bacillota bacterium]